MERAAVLIGVRGTGEVFPVLQAVDSSLEAMAEWLRSQGIAEDRLILLSDKDAPVTIAAIKAAISGLIGLGTIAQLIVYFSGHGVCIGSAEYWLLSGAPNDADEAVNVESSIALARRTMVPHTIVVSDACRSPSTDIQGQSITGGSMFPNHPPGGAEASVDVYFGCVLGTPSLEVKSVRNFGATFRSIFTSAFVDAVMGHVPLLLEADVASPGSRVVRGWPLKKHLYKEVTRRIVDENLPLQVNQTPDARISSPPEAWVSLLPEATGPQAAGNDVAADANVAVNADLAIDVVLAERGVLPPEPLAVTAERMLRDTLLPSPPAGSGFRLARWPSRPVSRGRHGATVRNPRLESAAEASRGRRATSLRSELPRGLTVHGAKRFLVKDMLGAEVSLDSLSDGSEARNVVVILASDAFVIVPVVPNGRTDLFWENEAIADVRLSVEGRSAPEEDIESLIEGAGALASFSPEPDAIRLLEARTYHAAMSLGAEAQLAYAMHDRGMTKNLVDRLGQFNKAYGFELFDIAMLAQALAPSPGVRVLPEYPILARGWSLVEAYVDDPEPSWKLLKRLLRDGLWSSYRVNALDDLFTTR